MHRIAAAVVLASVLAGAASLAAPAVALSELQPVLDGIQTNDLARHLQVLSSDAFEGRAPGSPGEEKTLRYLVDAFQRLGLEPGNPDGTWFQDVPLVGIKSAIELRAARGTATENWQFPQDFVAWSPRMTNRVEVRDSELVFVGYGVQAPEYGWDDFKNVDVRGKTLVMLVNDPPVPDPKNPAELDPTQFRGRAMTYYGRWTYKYEIAAAKGAAAALVVHETGPAGYPYFVVINSWGRENFDLRSPSLNTDKLALSGWVSQERARALFAQAGHEFDALKKSALRRDFRPLPLGTRVSFAVTNQLRDVRSRNVAARLPGSHPTRRDEYVVYTAHWDHIGRDAKLDGDQIFNGALDNASGTSVLLEIAEAFARTPRRPDRSILFLSVTAEEQGLLGAKFYAEHPLYPLKRTLANLNIDGANVAGPRTDVGVVGFGLNTLDDLLAAAARTQNRTVRPETEPEKGGYFRSDHFEFAKVGVPALYLDAGSDEIIGQPAGYGKKRRDEYREQFYHKVGDEMKPWWDLRGAADDARLLFLVGYDVANGDVWPEWRPGAEFKARREAHE